MRLRAGLVLLAPLCILAAAPSTRAADDAAQPAPDAPSPRDLARYCFSTAVSLARAGRYAAAKNLFLEAYAAEPHYLVLYNIAQADIQLGDPGSAASFLRRFLVEGGTKIGPDQRSAIEREIALLEGHAAKSSEPRASASEGTSSTGLSVSQPSTTPPPSSTSSATAATKTALISAEPPSEHSGRAIEPTTRDHGASRLTGYLLASSGFAVSGASVALFIWNHDRYERWQRENRLFEEYAGGSAPAGDAALQNESALRARVVKNNALLKAVQSFDPVPIVTAGIGVAAIVAGVWTLSADHGGDGLRLSAGPCEFELQGQWTW